MTEKIILVKFWNVSYKNINENGENILSKCFCLFILCVDKSKYYTH